MGCMVVIWAEQQRQKQEAWRLDRGRITVGAEAAPASGRQLFSEGQMQMAIARDQKPRLIGNK